MNMTRPRYVVAGTFLMLMTFPLHANPVLPGGTVAPDVFTIDSTPPLLGDISGAFDFTFGAGHLKGTWEEAVLVDPLGVTCSGCLDFAYQVTLDPSSHFAISQLGVTRFFGYSTDVGYVDESGDVAPNSVARGPAGGGVFFTFASFPPGQNNAYLLVATNARTYDMAGGLGVFGTDGVHNVSGQIGGLFEPTPVPEPSTSLLLSLGLAGIAAFRKRFAVQMLRSRN
jgi:hypothetical protein